MKIMILNEIDDIEILFPELIFFQSHTKKKKMWFIWVLKCTRWRWYLKKCTTTNIYNNAIDITDIEDKCPFDTSLFNMAWGVWVWQ